MGQASSSSATADVPGSDQADACPGLPAGSAVAQAHVDQAVSPAAAGGRDGDGEAAAATAPGDEAGGTGGAAAAALQPLESLPDLIATEWPAQAGAAAQLLRAAALWLSTSPAPKLGPHRALLGALGDHLSKLPADPLEKLHASLPGAAAAAPAPARTRSAHPAAIPPARAADLAGLEACEPCSGAGGSAAHRYPRATLLAIGCHMAAPSALPLPLHQHLEESRWECLQIGARVALLLLGPRAKGVFRLEQGQCVQDVVVELDVPLLQRHALAKRQASAAPALPPPPPPPGAASVFELALAGRLPGGHPAIAAKRAVARLLAASPPPHELRLAALEAGAAALQAAGLLEPNLATGGPHNLLMLCRQEKGVFSVARLEPQEALGRQASEEYAVRLVCPLLLLAWGRTAVPAADVAAAAADARTASSPPLQPQPLLQPQLSPAHPELEAEESHQRAPAATAPTPDPASEAPSAGPSAAASSSAQPLPHIGGPPAAAGELPWGHVGARAAAAGPDLTLLIEAVFPPAGTKLPHDPRRELLRCIALWLAGSPYPQLGPHAAQLPSLGHRLRLHHADLWPVPGAPKAKLKDVLLGPSGRGVFRLEQHGLRDVVSLDVGALQAAVVAPAALPQPAASGAAGATMAAAASAAGAAAVAVGAAAARAAGEAVALDAQALPAPPAPSMPPASAGTCDAAGMLRTGGGSGLQQPRSSSGGRSSSGDGRSSSGADASARPTAVPAAAPGPGPGPATAPAVGVAAAAGATAPAVGVAAAAEAAWPGPDALPRLRRRAALLLAAMEEPGPEGPHSMKLAHLSTLLQQHEPDAMAELGVSSKETKLWTLLNEEIHGGGGEAGAAASSNPCQVIAGPLMALSDSSGGNEARAACGSGLGYLDATGGESTAGASRVALRTWPQRGGIVGLDVAALLQRAASTSSRQDGAVTSEPAGAEVRECGGPGAAAAAAAVPSLATAAAAASDSPSGQRATPGGESAAAATAKRCLARLIAAGAGSAQQPQGAPSAPGGPSAGWGEAGEAAPPAAADAPPASHPEAAAAGAGTPTHVATTPTAATQPGNGGGAGSSGGGVASLDRQAAGSAAGRAEAVASGQAAPLDRHLASRFPGDDAAAAAKRCVARLLAAAPPPHELSMAHLGADVPRLLGAVRPGKSLRALCGEEPGVFEVELQGKSHYVVRLVCPTMRRLATMEGASATGVEEAVAAAWPGPGPRAVLRRRAALLLAAQEELGPENRPHCMELTDMGQLLRQHEPEALAELRATRPATTLSAWLDDVGDEADLRTGGTGRPAYLRVLPFRDNKLAALDLAALRRCCSSASVANQAMAQELHRAAAATPSPALPPALAAVAAAPTSDSAARPVSAAVPVTARPVPAAPPPAARVISVPIGALAARPVPATAPTAVVAAPRAHAPPREVTACVPASSVQRAGEGSGAPRPSLPVLPVPALGPDQPPRQASALVRATPAAAPAATTPAAPAPGPAPAPATGGASAAPSSAAGFTMPSYVPHPSLLVAVMRVWPGKDETARLRRCAALALAVVADGPAGPCSMLWAQMTQLLRGAVPGAGATKGTLRQALDGAEAAAIAPGLAQPGGRDSDGGAGALLRVVKTTVDDVAVLNLQRLARAALESKLLRRFPGGEPAAAAKRCVARLLAAAPRPHRLHFAQLGEEVPRLLGAARPGKSLRALCGEEPGVFEVELRAPSTYIVRLACPVLTQLAAVAAGAVPWPQAPHAPPPAPAAPAPRPVAAQGVELPDGKQEQGQAQQQQQQQDQQQHQHQHHTAPAPPQPSAAASAVQLTAPPAVQLTAMPAPPQSAGPRCIPVPMPVPAPPAPAPAPLHSVGSLRIPIPVPVPGPAPQPRPAPTTDPIAARQEQPAAPARIATAPPPPPPPRPLAAPPAAAPAPPPPYVLIDDPYSPELVDMLQHCRHCGQLGLSVKAAGRVPALVSLYAPAVAGGSNVAAAAGDGGAQGWPAAVYLLDCAAADGLYGGGAGGEAAAGALLSCLRGLLADAGVAKVVYGVEGVRRLEAAIKGGVAAVNVLDMQVVLSGIVTMLGLPPLGAPTPLQPLVSEAVIMAPLYTQVVELSEALAGIGLWADRPGLLAALKQRHLAAMRDALWAASGRDRAWLVRPLGGSQLAVAAGAAQLLPELWGALVGEAVPRVAARAGDRRMQQLRSAAGAAAGGGA
ncbi:hypothetical protein TSOC_010414 [Tetrabaena socialis]|uniref:Uncharacterized protein n=1 Tax=Tetrabaena socialis TaxID=47790 RepID=A0A2J7ZTC1_9CHLO|nr:hypothetical protein TSOC_010414 [Tetrabaena socialis]|eukprot:PNH03519.1 hypothetical protein TSOC_010414 [Tetrabaena socialis]